MTHRPKKNQLSKIWPNDLFQRYINLAFKLDLSKGQMEWARVSLGGQGRETDRNHKGRPAKYCRGKAWVGH